MRVRVTSDLQLVVPGGAEKLSVLQAFDLARDPLRRRAKRAVIEAAKTRAAR